MSWIVKMNLTVRRHRYEHWLADGRRSLLHQGERFWLSGFQDRAMRFGSRKAAARAAVEAVFLEPRLVLWTLEVEKI